MFNFDLVIRKHGKIDGDSDWELGTDDVINDRTVLNTN